MEILPLLLGGLGGGVITGSVNYYIFRKSRAKPTCRAYEVLRGLEKVLIESQGEYYVARSSQDNFRIANHLYTHADGPVIATAFHENPAAYGETDIARGLRYGGSLFTRLTSSDVCDATSTAQARTSLQRILNGAKLVVIPSGTKYVRLDGVFCRLQDDSHLCFFSLRDAIDPNQNRGVAFRDGIASHLFDYFQNLAGKYPS